MKNALSLLLIMTFSTLHSALCRGYWYIDPIQGSEYIRQANQFLNDSAQGLIKEDPAIVAQNAQKTAPMVIAMDGSMVKQDFTGESIDQFLQKATPGSISVIQIVGPTMKADWCGFPGTNTIGQWIQKSDTHPNIAGTILLMDTPGGSADGPAALNDIINATQKPVVVWIDGLMASAGVFIGSAADRIIANSPAALIGSIGTMTSMRDYSGLMASQGIKDINVVSDLSPDKNKAYYDAQKGDPQPLKNEILNPLTTVFHNYVIANRSDVNPDLKSAQEPLTGKMYVAQDALAYGLIDAIGSLADALQSVRDIVNEKNLIPIV